MPNANTPDPEMQVRETQAPKTQGPEAQAPDAQAPDAQAPDIPDGETPDKQSKRFYRQFQVIERRVPKPLARILQFLRRPWARLIRIPLGLLLIAGGIFSFLPVLGIWMLPLGLLLLAIDLPLLRPPVSNGIIRARWWYDNWRRKRKKN